MRGISPTGRVFAADQQPVVTLQYWDTASTALYNDVAATGLRAELAEPDRAGPFDIATTIKGGGSPGALNSAWAAYAPKRMVDGRLPNILGYWAGGAPGYHGATIPRRVAYRFTGTFRPAAERAWFSANTSQLIQFAIAGNGHVRLEVGGTVRYNGPVTEEAFVHGGPTWVGVTVTAGDTLDFYYVQDTEEWGGFVLKALAGTLPGATFTSSARRQAMRDAVVVGSGLFTRETVSPILIKNFGPVETEVREGQAPRLTVELSLLSDVNDGVGWVWVQDEADPLGHVVGTAIDGVTTTLKRHRLIRCSMGYRNPGGSTTETWPVFTGFIDGFDGQSDGSLTLTAIGFEQRMAEQFCKNYPDRLSYMMYDYRRRGGTLEPVYPVLAYDNWPLRYAIRDLSLRAGIDESRFAAPQLVPQADGTTVPVVM